MLVAELVRREDLVGRLDQGLRRDLETVDLEACQSMVAMSMWVLIQTAYSFTVLIYLCDLDVEPDIFVLSRNDHHAARVRVNGAAIPDIG